VDDPSRFRLLASALGRRPLSVASAAQGQLASTNGTVVFVTAGAALDRQRREVMVQAALLGAGSLERDVGQALRGRPKTARRYLALEGRRVLAELAASVPAVPPFAWAGAGPMTSSNAESLALAVGHVEVAPAPDWFGQIRPGQLLSEQVMAGGVPTERSLQLKLGPSDLPETDEDEEHEDVGKLLRLFQNPLTRSNLLSNLLANLLGLSRRPGEGAAGEELGTGSVRAAIKVGPHARPLPVPIRFVGQDKPGPETGLKGALYPEWDVHKKAYRAEWCRVLEVPLDSGANPVRTGVERDELLRRRLARLGLGPVIQRRRPYGEDLDLDALIDLAVDRQAQYTVKEHIYRERRNLRRDLGVLVLLDASGSATELDCDGNSVHEHQRRAAATLLGALEELGDRVALYAFRSRGRSAVYMLPLKTFNGRLRAGGIGRLARLEPNGFTRMGAAIRHAAELLKHDAGTPIRLLVVLSDGFPYDDGYEDRYGEADTRKALAEARQDGVACLCLSIGASTSTDALDRVFGAAAHAGAPRLSDLSGRMDELFLSAVKELSRARPRSDGRTARAAGATTRRMSR
jgi:Mg-chelatase subunit ChlD